MPQFDFANYLSHFIWSLVSFGCFFVICSSFISKAFAKIFNSRNNTIEDNIEFAQDILLKTDSRRHEILHRKNEMQKEINEIIKNAQLRVETVKKQKLNQIERANNQNVVDSMNDTYRNINISYQNENENIGIFVDKVLKLLSVKDDDKKIHEFVMNRILNKNYIK